MKSKILILHPSLEVGGAETQLRYLLKEYNRAESELVLVVFSHHSTSALEFANSVRVRAIPLTDAKSGGFLSKLNSLVKIIADECPDAVYSLLPNANLLNALASFSACKFSVIWGMRSSKFTLSRFGLRGAVVQLMTATFSRRVDLLISNTSAGLRQSNRGLFRVRREIVIPNGIDTARFRPDCEVRRRLRIELEISPEATAIGLIARVVSWKGYRIFLEAARTLKAEFNHELIFVCVGSGDVHLEQECVRFIKTQGLEDCVRWLGQRDDVHEVLSALDLLTVCSIEGEGFPNIIGEALATNVPVVATRIGDAPRIVQNNGIIISPNCVADLVKAWGRALESPEVLCNLARGARRRVISDYSVNKFATSTIREILTVITERQTHG